MEDENDKHRVDKTSNVISFTWKWDLDLSFFLDWASLFSLLIFLYKQLIVTVTPVCPSWLSL